MEPAQLGLTISIVKTALRVGHAVCVRPPRKKLKKASRQNQANVQR